MCYVVLRKINISKYKMFSENYEIHRAKNNLNLCIETEPG